MAHAGLVQYLGQHNNEYQFECVRRHPDRFVSVVLVATNRPDVPRELQRLAEQGARGVRLRPETRPRGDDPLAIWRNATDRAGHRPRPEDARRSLVSKTPTR